MFKFLFKCCCCWGKLGSATTTSRELVCCHSKFQPVLKKKVQRCFRIHELVVNQLFPSAGLWTLVLSSADVERCDGWFGYSQQTANSPPEGISCATHWFSHHRRRLALVQICRSRAVMFRRHSGGVGERRRESEKLTNISKSAAESILVVMWHPPPQSMHAGVCVWIRAPAEPDFQTAVGFSLPTHRGSRLNSKNLSPFRHVFLVGGMPSDVQERGDSQLTSLCWLVCHPHHLYPGVIQWVCCHPLHSWRGFRKL